MKSVTLRGVLKLALTGMLYCSVHLASAQENNDLNHEHRQTDELNQTLDGQAPVLQLREAQRDSLVIKPMVARPKTVDNPLKPKTEEEPLSFNFLYYIIQKFKGSDVVD